MVPLMYDMIFQDSFERGPLNVLISNFTYVSLRLHVWLTSHITQTIQNKNC